MSQRRIHLNIEELILHGVSAHEAHAIREAVQTELSTLLSEGKQLSMNQTKAISRLNADQVCINPNATARTTGQQIAQSVYGGLKK